MNGADHDLVHALLQTALKRVGPYMRARTEQQPIGWGWRAEIELTDGPRIVIEVRTEDPALSRPLHPVPPQAN
jgi:hypothetical protein